MNQLDGQVAVVTGGSRGIGRAVCRSLDAEGARVILHYHRNRAAAEETRASLTNPGPDCSKRISVLRQRSRRPWRASTRLASTSSSTTQESGNETDMTAAHLGNPETRERALQRHPLGRLATPEDIARAVVFLCTDASRFVTGESLNVSGGFVV